MGLYPILRDEWEESKLLDKLMYTLNIIFALVLLYGYRSYMDVDKMLLSYNTFFIIYGILLVLSIISTVSNHRRNKEVIKLEENINDIKIENKENINSIYEQKRQELTSLENKYQIEIRNMEDKIVFYKDRAANQEEKAVLFEKERDSLENELVKTQENLDKITTDLKDAHENVQKLNETAIKMKKALKLRKYAYRKCKERCETLEKKNWELKGKPRIKVDTGHYGLEFKDITLTEHTVEDRLEKETLLEEEAESLANELEKEL